MRITEQCDEYGRLRISSLEQYDLGKDKANVLNYMKSRGFVVASSSANAFDFVEGAKDHNYCRVDYSDQKYEWTSNDIMYVEKYNMKINRDFIKHILDNTPIDKPINQ